MKHLELAAPWRASPLFNRLGWWFGLMLATLIAFTASVAHAADANDPPDRAGRLAEVDGQAWIYATDSNEWIAALRNRPITTGDRLSTENDGRIEVRIGSTVLRVAPNTELEVLQLDDDHVNLQLHSGSVTARLRTREAASEFGLVTEEGRFRTDRTGNYRFDRIDDTSSATAASGQVVYEGDGTALTVQQGQRVEFWKERGVAQYSITDPKRDGFSDWVASRDAGDARSVSSRYVSPEMTGVEDLDRYGRWEQNADYGPLWIPREVAPGWAPYRMGHWAWVNPWGWTWVDDAPWGFAPFHYGRWVWLRNNWCWTPGRYVARPVYAPALVAWVGGSNFSVSVSAGRAPTVGWFPLAPREVYVPGYHVSPRYVRNVNVTQVTNITNVTTIINSPGRATSDMHYANRGLPHAVTVVPATVVERRQPVAPATSTVNDRVLRDMVRERPRADAPVAAPPRFAPGARPAVDPRVSRPGSSPNGGGASGFAAQPQQAGAPRVIGNGGERGAARGGDRGENRGDRAADRPGDRVGERPGDRLGDRSSERLGDRPGDRVGDRRGDQQPAPQVVRPATPPPVLNAAPGPAAAPPAARPQEPPRERERGNRGGSFSTVPNAPVNNAPPVANAPAPVTATPAQRAVVRGGGNTPWSREASPREGRQHNPEMPGPPRVTTQQAPAQAPPQIQQPRQQVAPPQVMRQPAVPPPQMRAPEVQRRPENPRQQPEVRGGNRERPDAKDR